MINSAEGHCDCGGGWLILFESDRDGGGGRRQYPFLYLYHGICLTTEKNYEKRQSV